MLESLQPWLRNNESSGPTWFCFVSVCSLLLSRVLGFSEIVLACRLLNGKMVSITAVKQILTFVCAAQCWAEVGFE